MLNVMFYMSVMLIFYHVFCCVDELLLMIENNCVSHNSYVTLSLNVFHLLKCMLFNKPRMSVIFPRSMVIDKVVLQFGIRAIKSCHQKWCYRIHSENVKATPITTILKS
jgi:hypothetical protein